MAKAVEDTLFFRFNRLIALNEVGGDPSIRGSLDSFHSAMEERAKAQPQGLSATATHDTKRGEDARARLYAISEAPRAWAEAVARWRGMNADAVSRLHDHPTPDAETEWLIYQSLAGAWPDEPDLDDSALGALRERFIPYVEKALREAKRHTSWTEIDEAFEGAVKAYAGRLLAPENRAFRDDFAATLRRFIRAGHLNSLSQTLIKMAAPGVPDIYQGSELADFSLVDPDNRRAVDFGRLSRRLEQGVSFPVSAEDLAGGAIKQHVIAQCLRLRRERAALFRDGRYVPLESAGRLKDNLVAFIRRHPDDFAIVVAPRLCFDFADEADPFAGPGWADTGIKLPADLIGRNLRNIFTGEGIRAEAELPAGPLLRICPVALLIG